MASTTDPVWNSSEDTAITTGSFQTQMRGYDKAQVDAYVRSLEEKIVDLRHRLDQPSSPSSPSEQTAFDAEIDVDRLSGHAAQILHASQAKADEIISTAMREAQQITAEATTAAQELTLSGQREVDTLRTSAMENLTHVREDQMREIQGVLDRTKSDADNSLAAAQSHSEALIAQAQQEAASIVETAQRQATQLRNEAELSMTQALATAQASRDTLVSEAHKSLEEAQAAKAAALAEIAAKQEASANKLAEETQLATNIRNTAVAEAEQIRRDATAHAQQLLTQAHHEITEMHQRVTLEAANRRNKLQADINALQQRKRSLTQQLGNLFGLGNAAATQFGEDNWDELPQIIFPDAEPDDDMATDVPVPADTPEPPAEQAETTLETNLAPGSWEDPSQTTQDSGEVQS